MASSDKVIEGCRGMMNACLPQHRALRRLCGMQRCFLEPQLGYISVVEGWLPKMHRYIPKIIGSNRISFLRNYFLVTYGL